MPSEIPPEGLIVCNLKHLMYERQLTVAEMARVANVTRPTIRKLRDDPTSPVESTTVAKLCHGLKVGVGVLLTHRTKQQIENEGLALMGADKS